MTRAAQLAKLLNANNELTPPAGIRFSDNSIQSAAAALGLGQSQTWQSMLSSRSANTTYTNSTGKPIAVVTRASWITRNGQGLYVDGQLIGYWGVENNYGTQVTFFAVVPNGSTYLFNTGADLWMELR